MELFEGWGERDGGALSRVSRWFGVPPCLVLRHLPVLTRQTVLSEWSVRSQRDPRLRDPSTKRSQDPELLCALDHPGDSHLHGKLL